MNDFVVKKEGILGQSIEKEGRFVLLDSWVQLFGAHVHVQYKQEKNLAFCNIRDVGTNSIHVAVGLH